MLTDRLSSMPSCSCLLYTSRTYEEAQKLYDKYSDNTLGVISDARFPLKSAAKAFGKEVRPEEKPKPVSYTHLVERSTAAASSVVET